MAKQNSVEFDLFSPSSPDSSTRPNIFVEYPKELGIKLVKANDFSEYNFFTWFSSLFLGIAVFFWTQFFTIWGNDGTFIAAIVLSLIFVLFVVKALIAYCRMKNEAQIRAPMQRNTGS